MDCGVGGPPSFDWGALGSETDPPTVDSGRASHGRRKPLANCNPRKSRSNLRPESKIYVALRTPPSGSPGSPETLWRCATMAAIATVSAVPTKQRHEPVKLAAVKRNILQPRTRLRACCRPGGGSVSEDSGRARPRLAAGDKSSARRPPRTTSPATVGRNRTPRFCPIIRFAASMHLLPVDGRPTLHPHSNALEPRTKNSPVVASREPREGPRTRSAAQRSRRRRSLRCHAQLQRQRRRRC